MTGLLDFGQWQEANLIRSDAGAVRGNHYHKYTTEAFVLLEGQIQLPFSASSTRSLKVASRSSQ